MEQEVIDAMKACDLKNARQLAMSVDGVSEATLSRWFSGQGDMGASKLKAIADALGFEWRLIRKR